jgi:hypothetical protein
MKARKTNFPATPNLTAAKRGNGDRKENLCSLRFLLLNGSKLFSCATALVLGILGHTTAHAQLGGVPLWVNVYPDVSATAIAVDRSGDVIVAGNFDYSGGSYDYAIIKYSGAGALLWESSYNGPGNNYDFANAVAVDGSGNVFVTGSSSGVTNLYPDNNYDYATIKYSAAGVPLWTNRYNGPGNSNDTASAIAVASSGDVFVTGFSIDANGYYSYATIKYSGAGVPLWTNRYNSGGRANAVAVDGSGNVIVTGYPATVKYSGAGVPLWTNHYDGVATSLNQAHALAVDSSGNVFVTGESALDTNSQYHYATIKYSGAGVALWTNLYSGPANLDDYPNAVAVDGSGNVFVTGYSTSGAGFEFVEYATIGYSGAGVPLWTNRYAGGLYNIARSMAVDGNGNVFVTGSFWNVISESYECATIKYSSAIPPSLSVTRTATNTVVVSWPSPSTRFALQQNTSGLGTVNWSNVVAAPSDDGTTKTVIVNPPTGNRFYRLFHP